MLKSFLTDQGLLRITYSVDLCHSTYMKWVGLTGGIASGKTTVANIFRELGVPVVDADRLARMAFSRSKDKIINYFGRDILDTQGEIDRRKLGQVVFADEKKRKTLESLIHPYVQEKVEEKKRLFEVAGHDLAIYDVPLLFENNLADQFDEVLVVYLPEDKALERLLERNPLTPEEAKDRIQSQMNIDKKKELADEVFDNQGDKDQLRQQVLAYYRAY